MSQKTFSRRTVAIAVAASVAVGGAPIVGANGPLAFAANAQETDQNAKPGIQATDAKYVGVFSKDGEKITGTLTSGNAQKGTPLTSETGAIMRTSINLANAAPGDRINVKPQTTFSYPNGQEITNSHAGLRIPTTVEPQNLEYKGQVIGTWRYVQSGALEIVFNDNIADVTEGTLNVDAPIMVWNQWTDYKAFNVKDGEWDGRQLTAETSGSPVIVVDAVQKQGGKKTTNTLRTNQNVIFNVIAQNSIRDMFRHYESGSVVTNTEDLTVSAKGDTIEFPAGANGTVTTKPDTTRDDTADWTYAANLKFEPRFREYGKRGADNEHTTIGESMSLEEAQAKYPGINANASIKNGTITATTANVPENVKVTFRITPGEGETAVKYATYLENGLLRTEEKFQGTINGEETTFNGATHALTRIVRIPGAPSLDGVQTLNWTAALDGAIQGQPDGAGKNGNTAQIGGTTQTFQFFVKNNGNAYLAAPLVTLPNGKRVPVKGVGIKPGEEGSFTVDYNVPAGSGVLNFEVSMGKADFQPTNKISFRYADADQSTVAGDNIKYPTDKKAPRGQITTVSPSGVPKGASAVRTENTPAWAEIGPDGKLTLKPNNSAPLGRTEIPVKFTFSDGSATTVNPVITVAEEDPSKSTFDPRTEDEKSNDEINKRLDELEEATNKQTDKLDEIGTALDKSNKLTQDQIDAIKDQTDKLDKAIKDQSKAINDLKDVTEKGNKALVDAMKKQSDAIESALDSVEATIREGDARALEEAKKQTKALERNNQLIAEQNKELANQTDQLKKQAEQLKKQADALDKANKLTEEQNKLIADQIKATEDLIAATEAQTAEITARLDKANDIAAEQRDIMRKELAESIKQTAEMKKHNQILIDQHRDQLAQWEKENQFAQNAQDDRRHKDNFKRCVTSDPATAVLVALPVLSLMVAAGIPYTGHMLEDANTQLTQLNNRLGAQVNIPADLQRQINAFNAENGDLVRVGASTAGVLAALAGLAVAVNHLVNGCYAEADISVGREPRAPKTSSESVLSSKPWIQEAPADKAAAGAKVATQ